MACFKNNKNINISCVVLFQYQTWGPWWSWIAHLIWYNFVNGHPRNTCAKLFQNQAYPFDKKFLKFTIYYIHTRKSSPNPWQSCFPTDRNNLNASCRRLPKALMCQIIVKSVQDFWTRRFLKLSLNAYKENKLRPPGGHVFERIRIHWTVLKEGQKLFIAFTKYV